MAVVWSGPDADDAVRRYLAGESVSALAAEYGRHRCTIREAARRAGHSHSVSEAMRLRMKRDPESVRVSLAMGPQGLRGKPRTEATMLAKSTTRQRNGTQIGEGERLLAGWLAERGWPVEAQRSVRRYNLDLSTPTVAIEVHSLKRSPMVRPHAQRIKDLTDWGWHVIYVWVTETHPLQPGAADDIVAFLDGPGRKPSAPGQYRVLRGCGELVIAGCGDVDERAGVRLPFSAHRLSSGHPYQRVPG